MASLFALLRPALVIISLLGLVPSELPADYLKDPPGRVLASVRVANGGSTCSATIISRGPRWACGVGAGHCFQGNIGGKFKIHFADGSQCEATLLAIDRSIDVARFAVPAEAVLAVVPIPSSLSGPAIYEACGFPRGDGPFYYRLSPASDSVSTANGMTRWKFSVDGGGAIPGCSGCGIFANGKLCGVLSHNDGGEGKICYGCPLPALRAFLDRTDQSGCDRWQMGNWLGHHVASHHAPRPLAIRSGGRIELMPPPADPGCPGGNCPLPRRIAEVPAPPPDADPGRSIPYANPSDQHEAPYDGRGRPPEGLRTPRQRSSEIDKLRKYLAEREHETPALPPDDHEPPYVGPGPDDPLPKEKSPVLAFVLGALAFVGVYAVKFHKAAQAV